MEAWREWEGIVISKYSDGLGGMVFVRDTLAFCCMDLEWEFTAIL